MLYIQKYSFCLVIKHNNGVHRIAPMLKQFYADEESI